MSHLQINAESASFRWSTVVIAACVVLVVFLCSGFVWAQDPAPKEKKAPEKDAVGAGIRDLSGIEFSVLESYVRRSIASGSKTRYGFKVRRVVEGSPAAKAGLRKGDILMEWDGKPIRRLAKLHEWMSSAKKDGKEHEVRYSRLKRTSILDRKPWKSFDSKIKLGKKKRKFRIY